MKSHPINICAIFQHAKVIPAALWLGASLLFGPGETLARVDPESASRAAPSTDRDDRFGCGGALEKTIWELWDEHGRTYMKDRQIVDRLMKNGDTYALYDIQTIFHNLEAMAQRCERTERLIQLADDLLVVFDALAPIPGKPDSAAWICRGGWVCNDRNRLVNTEVMLVSVQGLGLLSTLARHLAISEVPAARSHPFIARTVNASLSHLRRWATPKERAYWRKLASMTVLDVKDAGSAIFFTDKHLWQIAIYANLSGIAMAQPEQFSDAQPGTAEHRELAEAISELLHLFRQRLTLTKVEELHIGSVETADLDAGFWRLYPDNRYAGYQGNTPPAVCEPENKSNTASTEARLGTTLRRPTEGSAKQPMKAKLLVDSGTIPPVKDLGWDFSHASRLVHVLDALTTNRQALENWWGLTLHDTPPDRLAKAFAAQILVRVWNGNYQKPLFTNYWNGSNGWYRVAYNNGTGTCYSGYPPFGLTDSFSTGGYAQWAKYYPEIGMLGRTIYVRSQSEQPEDIEFIRRFYPKLTKQASPATRKLNEMMFWPSLVD